MKTICLSWPRLPAVGLLVLLSGTLFGAETLLNRVANAPPTQLSGALGVGWADADNDGKLDLYVVHPSAVGALFRNDPVGTFTLAANSGIALTGSTPTACAWADYDNDGLTDLLVTYAYDKPALWRNGGSGRFSPAAGTPFQTPGAACYGAAWGDYDNDGKVDVIVFNAGAANQLYHNEGSGVFTQVTTGAVATESLVTVGGAWGDYDNDNRLDLFLANGSLQDDTLFHNEGGGVFTKVTVGPVVSSGGESQSCAWGDYDNDGYLDLFVANRLGKNFLYHNERNGTFTSITSGPVVTDPGESNGCGWADYDNDGDLDLFVARWQGGQNALYRNEGGGTFVRVTEGDVAGDAAASVGVAWGDYDNDGHVDLFVGNYTATSYLYRNEGSRRHWLKVRCAGSGVSNRSSLGAKVHVKATVRGTESWQMRQIGGAHGWTDDGLEALFGLGEATTVDLVRVEWPSGVVNELQNVAVNQVVPITENVGPLYLVPAAGQYDQRIQIQMFTSVANGAIHYSLDGTEPTAASPLFERPFGLSQSAVVRARTFLNGEPASEALSAAYEIVLTPPVIQTEAASRTTVEGEPVTFPTVVTGSLPRVYQWKLNGTDVAGATNLTLNIPAVGLDQAGVYSLAVTNDAGGALKELLTLVVTPKPVAPTILTQPEGQTVVVGGTATFMVAATGTEPLSYEWRDRLGRPVGNNSPTLTLVNVQTAQAGNYTVRVRNSVGVKTSSPALLTVVDQPIAPAIVSAPWDVSAPVGSLAIFVVGASGTVPLSYQWHWNGAPIAAGTGPRLILTSVAEGQAGTYTVRVTNPAGSVLSGGAVLEVVTGGTGGTVELMNRLPTAGIDVPITDADGTTRLAGASYLAQLYGGPTAEALVAVGAALPFGTGESAGYFGPGAVPRIIPSVAGGSTAFVQVRAWETAAGPTYEAAVAAGGKAGASEVFEVLTGGGEPPAPPGRLIGLRSFAIVPEAVPPQVSVTTPAAGITADERFTLRGIVSDNIGVSGARWEWDGQPQGGLTLAEGQFSLPGLKLHRGDNRLRVIASDRAGNEGVAEVTVRWEPLRTLGLADAPAQQEGQRVLMELGLASGGDVVGLSFVLRYDPELLADAEFSWAGSLAGGIRQLNYDTPGEVRGTLAVSEAIGSGVQAVGQLSLRARSVPARTTGRVTVQVADISDALGNQIVFGTDGLGGEVTVVPRRAVGDNNGNHRLDIGDATVIQRLVVHLDPVRAWDVTGNDLNQSGDLDSGDAVKVLRAVLGLDPQPEVGGGVGLAGGGVGGLGGNGRVILTADRFHASAGEPITVQVRLEGQTQAMMGVAFAIEYPPAALQLAGAGSIRPGAMVPGEALAMWNVSGGYGAQEGRASCALSSATAWPSPNGVVAELTFVVQAGMQRAVWPVRVTGAEATGAEGYELRPFATAELALNPLPELRSVQMTETGLLLTFDGAPGLDYTVESSVDLREWQAIGTRVSPTGLMQFLDTAAKNRGVQFYRVREGR